MQSDKKKKNENTDYDYLGKSASTHDCTGLIPTPVQNEEEIRSYENIYPFLPNTPKTK